MTRWLRRMREGDKSAEGPVFELVYKELRRIAGQIMAGERPGHILQPTALVHEAYIRIFDSKNVDLSDRNHFFAIASVVMRRVLIDHAKAVKSQKRGGQAQRVSLTDIQLFSETRPEEFIALDAALEKLAKIMPQYSQVVELHFFGGLTFDQIAEVMDISSRTARRHWEAARRWLDGELNGWTDDSGPMGEGE